jgi:beta-1,4-mannosyl-glycoprotein beta-1,4-N-acetylglucosaminyltransferase
MKVFDVFLFFNELDLLEIRLNMLYPFVDCFVINEATQTFFGSDKPLYYLENKERFKKFEDKIIHNIIEPPTIEQLDNMGEKYGTPVKCYQTDAYQKDSIKNFLNTLCSSNDVIIWSDLDEIPNPEVIENLNDFYEPNKVYNFAQEYCMCYLNMVEKTGIFRSQTSDFDYESYPKWLGTKLFSFNLLDKYSLTDMRRELPNEENIRISPGGWHWTYVGSNGLSVEERVLTKINSAAHQEYNNDSVKSAISIHLRSNNDPLGRGGCRYEIVEIDDTYPKFIIDNLNEYSYLIKDVIH